METGGTNDGREGARPPPLPANLPPVPVNYRLAPTEVRWAAVATFGSIGEWYRAKNLLSRRGITCLMGDGADFELRVLSTELAWAQELLRTKGAAVNSADRPTGGFPVVPKGSEATSGPQEQNSGPTAMPALPPDVNYLTPQQERNYTTAIWVLWGLLIVVLYLLVLGFIL